VILQRRFKIHIRERGFLHRRNASCVCHSTASGTLPVNLRLRYAALAIWVSVCSIAMIRASCAMAFSPGIFSFRAFRFDTATLHG
jgi:hypothetical protein